MKKSACISIFFFIVLCAKGQFGGEFIFNTYFGYVNGGEIRNNEGEKRQLGYTFRISPSMGHFIFNDLALGIGTSYEYAKDEGGVQKTWEVLPFIRFYAPGGDVRFFIHTEGGKGWGNCDLSNDLRGKHSYILFTMRPGIFLRVSDYFATEIKMGVIEYKKLELQVTGHRKEMTADWKFRILDFNFGFSFIFEF